MIVLSAERVPYRTEGSDFDDSHAWAIRVTIDGLTVGRGGRGSGVRYATKQACLDRCAELAAHVDDCSVDFS